ncbi:hypothetical protein O1W69_03830 [Chlamydia sp. 12-01]|uniref:hypothetical protein n=1 Tax=Chlamydia sp. 12-01 TaxID=3002742 RepID=UPI0035D4B03A
MGLVTIPRHTHIRSNGSICSATITLPRVIKGCPTTLEGVMSQLQHIPLVLIPIVGLVYAGVCYYRYRQAQIVIKDSTKSPPNVRCPQCRKTIYAMLSPVAISILGGLGLMLPLLVILLPTLLIIGLSKTIVGIGKCITAGAKCCLRK